MIAYRGGMTKPSASPRPRRIWGTVVLIAGAATVLAACTSTGGNSPATGTTVTVTAPNGSTSVITSTPRTSAKPTPAAKAVHVKLLNYDGQQTGVGMPIIAFFSRTIGNAAPLQQATKVTVNGTAVQAAWYFETSSYYKGYPIEGHLRTHNYWPAHSTIHADLPIKGVSAGHGMAFDDSLTLSFSTGAANISTVDDASHTITVVSDGKTWGRYPVSLGAADTPTARGTKVIMEKGASICMSGPGYSECGVKWTQRLTYGGEYLHSAPWNIGNINSGVDSSNGCTNMLPADAQKLYGFLGVGDVVLYPNANGPRMQLGAGYGDWNVPWSQWLTGGLVSTTA